MRGIEARQYLSKRLAVDPATDHISGGHALFTNLHPAGNAKPAVPKHGRAAHICIQACHEISS